MFYHRDIRKPDDGETVEAVVVPRLVKIPLLHLYTLLCPGSVCLAYPYSHGHHDLNFSDQGGEPGEENRQPMDNEETGADTPLLNGDAR